MYRNGNYCAFYVDEPFSATALRANATPDFVYYNLLRAWAANDVNFHFIDSHMKTYNVRDDSDWESTLKPRLHMRLRSSKNIILFLSSITRNSRALREEIDYGINVLGLPVIVIYPEYKSNIDIIYYGKFTSKIIELWRNVPIFENSMDKVPTLHIPFNIDLIKRALNDKKFTVQSKCAVNQYFYEEFII